MIVASAAPLMPQCHHLINTTSKTTFMITVKIVAYIILVVPVVLFAIVGVNNESFIEFLLEYLAYKKKRRKMKFRLPMKLSEKRKKKLLGK